MAKRPRSDREDLILWVKYLLAKPEGCTITNGDLARILLLIVGRLDGSESAARSAGNAASASLYVANLK